MIINKPRIWKYQLLLALFIAFVIEIAFFSSISQALTVFTMNTNNSVARYDPTEPQFATSTNRYVFRYKIPEFTSFDRIVFNIPSGELYPSSKFLYWGLYNDVGDPFYSCNDYSPCIAGDTLAFESSLSQGYLSNPSYPTGNTMQFTLSTSTPALTNSTQYLVLTFDPNTPFNPDPYLSDYVTYQTINGMGWSENGYSKERINSAPTIKLCNGVCDDFIFNIVPVDNFIIGNYLDTFNTRFTDVSLSGTSTSLNLNVDYFLNTSEYNSNNRPDAVSSLILKKTFFGDEQVSFQQKIILPLTDGSHSKNVALSHSFDDGNYFGFVNFWNININGITFKRTSINYEFTISGGVITDFNILDIFDGLALDEIPEYEDCGITNIDGCIKNALRFIFYPSQTVLNDFGDIWQDLSTLPPFGYVTSAFGAISSLGTSASSTWSFGSIPFMDSIFGPIRNALAPIIWGLYGIFFYKRIRSIDF